MLIVAMLAASSSVPAQEACYLKGLKHYQPGVPSESETSLCQINSIEPPFPDRKAMWQSTGGDEPSCLFAASNRS